MLQGLLQFHSKPVIDFLIKLIISLILLVTIAPLTVGVKENMPITLQTLVIVQVAVLWGWQIGGLSTLLYVLIGLLGAPVFSNHTGGFGHLNGIFGGFFFGFVVAAVLAGFAAEQKFAKNPIGNFSIWIGAHAIVLLFGAIWLRKFNPDNWQGMIKIAMPGALIKSAFGLLLTQIIFRLAAGRTNYYNKTKKA